MRINYAGLELYEFGFHGVVDTCSETFEIRSCSFQRSFLAEVVQRYIISVFGTATRKVYVVVLADTRLKHFFKPIRVGIIHKMVSTCCTVEAVSSRQRCIRVGCCLTQILAVLVGVHHVVNSRRNIIHTEVSVIVYFQRLVFLTAFGGDDNHTVGST